MIYIVVFIIYFAFIVISALASAKKVESMADFTVGGNKMGLFLGVGTSIATWLSVASVMGVPGNLYSRGVASVIGWVAGWFFATALMPLIAYKIRFPEIPTRTFPEFMRLRYEPKNTKGKLQLLVAIIMLIGYFVFSYIQIQGFGIIFSTITGIRYEYGVFFFLAVLVFTCLGGFMSVAATDTLNAFFIFIGVIVAMGTVLSLTGGYGPIFETIRTTTAPTFEGGPPLAKGILATPLGTFGFSALASIFLSNSLGAAVAPHWVARFMAPKNAKAAAMQMTITLFLLVGVFVPLITIGLGAKLIIPSLPQDRTTDYLFPLLIMEYCHPFVGALALTAICAAAVSTANSMLLHCATSIVYDIKRQLTKVAQTAEEDAKTTKQLRITILGLGVLATIFAIRPFALLAMGFTYVYGAFGSAFFWPVILGIVWKRMNRAGAYAGIIGGMVGYIYVMAAGITIMPPFLIGMGISLAATLIAVFATPKPPLEAYESFFEPKISDSTRQVILAIQRDIDAEKA